MNKFQAWITCNISISVDHNNILHINKPEDGMKIDLVLFRQIAELLRERGQI